MTIKPVDKYAELEAYVFFIGYQQSGHSIIGSLLDAHPHAVVGHELHAIKLWNEGVGRTALFDAIVLNTWSSCQKKRLANGYTYAVPGQWQGKYRSIKVIGDKKGGLSTGLLAKNQDVIPRFRDYIGLPLRVIHVTRNPFDNIASIQLRSEYDAHKSFGLYSTAVINNQKIREMLEPDELMDFSHEDFIKDPKTALVKLCQFIGLEPEAKFLEDCSAIVNPTPSRTRHFIDWNSAVYTRVNRLIHDYSFLKAYSFEK